MSDPITPTAEDLARDLAADLKVFTFHSALFNHAHIARLGVDMLPAAIRRALAAEAEVVRLRRLLGLLYRRWENGISCQDVGADGQADGTFIGNAFRLDDLEDEILAALKETT